MAARRPGKRKPQESGQKVTGACARTAERESVVQEAVGKQELALARKY